MAYHNLFEASATKKTRKEKSSIAEQKRQGIRKEIFFKQGNARLRLKLTAENSTLELVQIGAEAEIIEKLKNVQGLMQEELYYLLPDGREAFLQGNGRLLLRNGDPSRGQDWADYPLAALRPMQILRYFEAEQATYFYQDNHLIADRVRVARYVLPGHTIAENIKGLKPMMTGITQSAELNMAAKSPQFKAIQLRATFYQMGEP